MFLKQSRYLTNILKDIGRLVQIIRIERRGIIYGTDLWELISKIFKEDEICSDLNAELENYEFSHYNMNIIINRIEALPNFNTSWIICSYE